VVIYRYALAPYFDQTFLGKLYWGQESTGTFWKIVWLYLYRRTQHANYAQTDEGIKRRHLFPNV